MPRAGTRVGPAEGESLGISINIVGSDYQREGIDSQINREYHRRTASFDGGHQTGVLNVTERVDDAI
jgi:hypothetical protein